MNAVFSKNMNEENFPVAALAGRKLRPTVEAYYAAARYADDIADTPNLTTEEKLSKLNKAEKAFFAGMNGQQFSDDNENAYRLGRIFHDEKLDASLYTDLLKAFTQDARNTPIAVWEQLIDYCRLSAAPVGRFILALHDEPPSAYLAAETLCAVLQISNHLQDLRQDAENLRRCYLPQELMDKHDVRFSDIYLSASSPQFKALIGEIVDKLQKMLRDASVLPALVKSKRLKMQIGIILSLTNSMLKKIIKHDVLITHVHLSITDWAKALSIGMLQGLMRKTGKAANVL